MMVVDQVEVLVPLHSVLVAVDQVVAVPVVAVDQVVVVPVVAVTVCVVVVAVPLAPVSVVVALADCNLAGPLCATCHSPELVLRRPGHQPAAESSQLPWPESSLQPSSAPC